MKTIIASSVLLAAACGFTTGAIAKCPALESAARKKIEAINARMGSASACRSQKMLIQVLDINLDYLNRCRSADPQGLMKSNVLRSRNQARENAKAICN